MSEPVSNNGHEHELEPQYGLPEPLPADEHILWQGSPEWRSLAVRVFHVRKLVIYFALILAVRASLLLSQGDSVGDTLIDILKLSLLPMFALVSIVSVAWLSSRTTVYTITDNRIVMRVGIVLTLTFNLPLRTLRNADLHTWAEGTGDIAVQLPEHNHIAYLHLWPHARPWYLKHPEPMLRCVPDAASVAEVLAKAWSEAAGTRHARVGVTAGAPVCSASDPAAGSIGGAHAKLALH
jgi:hypothetical protein